MRVLLALRLPVLRQFLLVFLADFGASLLLLAQLFLTLRLRRASRLHGLQIARLPHDALLCLGQHRPCTGCTVYRTVGDGRSG